MTDGTTGSNEALDDLLPLWRQRRLYRRPLRALRERSRTRSMPSWQAFFAALKDDRTTVVTNAEGASWRRPNWPIARQRRTRLGARRQLGPQSRRPSATRSRQGRRAGRRRSPTPTCSRRRAIQRPRHHDDPRLPHARPSARQSRSARPRAAATTTTELHPATYGFTEADSTADLHRQRARARIRDHPRDARDPAAHLLLDARRRVHAHLRSRPRRPGSRSASRGRTRRSPSPARASAPS